MDRDMWQEWGHKVGSVACAMLWGHVAEVVAVCGGMWQG